MPILIAIWIAVAGVVTAGTVKDLKMEKAVKQFDQERVARNDDKELAEHLERIAQLRGYSSVADSLSDQK